MTTAGRIYYGPFDARRLVISVDGDEVLFQDMPTCRQREPIPLAEFDAWKAESDRRIYYGTDYDNRRELRSLTEEEAAYIEPARPGPEIVIPRAEWDAWVAALPA